jgi:hypothetical protein
VGEALDGAIVPDEGVTLPEGSRVTVIADDRVASVELTDARRVTRWRCLGARHSVFRSIYRTFAVRSPCEHPSHRR